ncbi:MAG: hypothetical protein ACP5H2_05370 [Solirubrobacteraceae bacterium]
MILEFIEDQVVDDLVEAVTELGQAGYKVALDDFTMIAEYDRLLRVADYVKLDYAALGPDGFAKQLAALEP